MNEVDQTHVEYYGELGAMLFWQKQLSTTLGVHKMPTQEGVKAMIECLAVEAAETLAPFLTKTKPWKPQEVDMAHVKEEAIDILHFLLAIFNLMGMDSEAVVEEYRRKNLINWERISAKMAEFEKAQNESK